MKKHSGQHTFFKDMAAPIPNVGGGNKITIPGGRDATPDRLPTAELVTNIPSAPSPGTKIGGRVGAGPGTKNTGLKK